MIFGTNVRKAAIVGILVSLWATSIAEGFGGSVPPSSSDWTLEQMTTRLKAQREWAIAFEEKTYSSLLSEPLTVSGVLRFTPPDSLQKEIIRPYSERYIVEGGRVSITSAREGIKRTIALDDYPGLRTLVEAFRASMMGDEAQLRRLYETTIVGTRDRWSLSLRPRDADGRKMVHSIIFTGRDGRIETVTIRAPDGDRSVMTLSREGGE